MGCSSTSISFLLNLEFSVQVSSEAIAASMKLHNFCIDHGEATTVQKPRNDRDKQVLQESATWYEDGKHNLLDRVGRPYDCRHSRKREMLIDIIKKGGYARPAVAISRMPKSFEAIESV